MFVNVVEILWLPLSGGGGVSMNMSVCTIEILAQTALKVDVCICYFVVSLADWRTVPNWS